MSLTWTKIFHDEWCGSDGDEACYFIHETRRLRGFTVYRQRGFQVIQRVTQSTFKTFLEARRKAEEDYNARNKVD